MRETPDALAEDDEADEEGTGRDVLGEMEIAARIMITGGDECEIDLESILSTPGLFSLSAAVDAIPLPDSPPRSDLPSRQPPFFVPCAIWAP